MQYGGGLGNGENNESSPTIVGYVVYRYRLDGREWHKKGGTEVEGEKAESTRVKGLRNGLVYR